MNQLLLRVIALLLHVLANVYLVNLITELDVGATWLKFTLFVLAVAVILFFFVQHLISFIQYIKTRP